MEGVLGYTTAFAGNFAPMNWMFCAGQLLSISQNTALFSILGTTYGGNGTTIFALPDLRGRAVVSAGTGPGLPAYDLGEEAGAETALLTMSQMPAHQHPVLVTITPAASGLNNSASPAGAVYGTSSNTLYNYSQSSYMKPYQGSIAMGNSGGGLPFSVVHPVLPLNYIICIAGVFPARN